MNHRENGRSFDGLNLLHLHIVHIGKRRMHDQLLFPKIAAGSSIFISYPFTFHYTSYWYTTCTVHYQLLCSTVFGTGPRKAMFHKSWQAIYTRLLAPPCHFRFTNLTYELSLGTFACGANSLSGFIACCLCELSSLACVVWRI